MTRRDMVLGDGHAHHQPPESTRPASSTAPAPPVLRHRPGKPSDIRVEDVQFQYRSYHYRTPFKFGGTATDRITILDALCRVRTRDGKVAHGFGSMPLGNRWSFPSKALSYDETLAAMRALTPRVSELLAGYPEQQHPVDITWALEPEYLKAAEGVTAAQNLAEPIPKLCVLVVMSPFDAALHDALGKAYGRSVYTMYGPEHMTRDLSAYLGDRFRGRYLQDYVRTTPQPRMPLYHVVGALDPIDDSDLTERLNDGLPETLPEWIRAEGLTRFKIKLNGNDLGWDVERLLRIDRAVSRTQRGRGAYDWVYSLDFNEQCPNVEYVLDFMRRIQLESPERFRRIQYVEQPTARDLAADPENMMHEAAKLKPIVIDESLTDHDSLRLAREMGYSGAALKACKGLSQALVLGAALQEHEMFLCVQDLTCSGASLIVSAGLSAHVPHVVGIEANARQYVPAANRGWEDEYPDIFRVADGTMKTSTLNRAGLSLPLRTRL